MKLRRTIIGLCILSCSLNGFGLTSEEKSAIVEGIYKKVYASMGTAEEKPAFLFDTKQASKIAYMMKDRDGNPIIGFEEKAFDVCQQFGARRDEAIAYLIGHEISHHHYAHHWGTDFSTAYSVNNLITELKAVNKEAIKGFETQADERGGIYCYLAGFNVQGLSEGLLRKLYEAYGITNSPNYPTLDERIQIAKERDSIVSTYIKVFETANYAMMISEYEIAIDGYEFVIGKGFHSREIYNNLGVAYFLQGISLSDEDEIKYIYPVELDLESRISRGSVKGMGDNMKELFEKARDKFEQATLFDKTYSTGYLNMACAQAILKEFEDAEYSISKAIKAAKAEGRTNVENNALLVKAILMDQNPEADKAAMKQLMADLVKKGNQFAKYNQQIMEGKSIENIDYSPVPVSWNEAEYTAASTSTNSTKELIDEVRTYEGKLDVLYTEEIQYTRFESIVCGTKEYSLIYKVSNKNGDTYVFHTTKPGYTKTTSKGIKVGSTKNQLIEAYGLPRVAMNARQGMVLMYPKNKLIFVLDENDCISSWALIRVL